MFYQILTMSTQSIPVLEKRVSNANINIEAAFEELRNLDVKSSLLKPDILEIPENIDSTDLEKLKDKIDISQAFLSALTRLRAGEESRRSNLHLLTNAQAANSIREKGSKRKTELTLVDTSKFQKLDSSLQTQHQSTLQADLVIAQNQPYQLSSVSNNPYDICDA